MNTEIKKIIFNNPATIVYWEDGTKTIVKCGSGDTWDKEKGLAMCFVKKLLGNKGNFNEKIKKYVKEDVYVKSEPKKPENTIEKYDIFTYTPYSILGLGQITNDPNYSFVAEGWLKF